MKTSESKYKQTKEALEFSEERFRAIAETSVDAIISVDSLGNIIFWNRAAKQQFGYTQGEVVGRNVTILIPERYRSAHRRGMARFLRTGKGRYIGKTVELYALKKDRSEFPIELSLAAWKTKGETFFTAIIRDISERKQTEETIRELAYYDILTGLSNRISFNDRLTLALAQAQRKAQKLAVILLDLDQFKEINDRLGHGAGDQLLKSVGDRLKNLLRKSDTVARMGGDEFMLLLPEIAQAENATKIAQKILEAFRRPFVFDNHELQITTSIGIAIYPKDGTDVETLVKNADIAMYHAKEQGRNNYQHYNPTRIPKGRSNLSSRTTKRGPLLDKLRTFKNASR